MKDILGHNPGLERFAVLFFNVEQRWWRDRPADNASREVSDLLRFAEGLSLEGATDLGAALREAVTRYPEGDIFLLSDGAATWGERDTSILTELLPPDITVFAYRTGAAGGSSRALSALSGRSGGAVFSLNGPTEVEAASQAHRYRAWRLVSVELPQTDDVLVAVINIFMAKGLIE